MKRKHIGLKTKLAAALCQMLREVDGRWELIVTHDEAKAKTEDEILSKFNWDHYPITHAEGGPDAHWNLEARPIAEHRIKTHKIDIPGIAKRKRVADAHEAFGVRRLTPRSERPVKKSRWGSRPFPKRSKKWSK